MIWEACWAMKICMDAQCSLVDEQCPYQFYVLQQRMRARAVFRPAASATTSPSANRTTEVSYVTCGSYCRGTARSIVLCADGSWVMSTSCDSSSRPSGFWAPNESLPAHEYGEAFNKPGLKLLSF